MNIRTLLMAVVCCLVTGHVRAQRKEISIDKGWRFALGHASNASKDFGHGTAGFSYFAKAGYGDGPAAAGFDDRSWRVVDLPHDWAVELPFDPQGSHSHGYRAMGRNFPKNSVGWYRKSFFVQRSQEGRRFVIRFDGVFRDSRVWVNGFYLGNEQSGYNGFSYDITDYIRYGGDNCIAVRADASMEEGWFYEGAGIYRHVWLVETDAAHVGENGVCVRTDIEGAGVPGAGAEMRARAARLEAGVSLVNDGGRTDTVSVRETILDGNGKEVATGSVDGVVLAPRAARELSCVIHLPAPRLWSVDDPYLYKVVTSLWRGGTNVDSCITTLGVRQIRWDADSGFFLNGRPLKLKGTNDHQDHAGVGVAVPDELWEYRLRCLKGIGSNAYRCAHNPPAPELLDACDRLGILVIDENRWMGTTPQITGPLRRMILRDRNHPCIIAWSIGNEEWAMEGTETGARVASTMQDYVHRLDSTRPVTVAVSGGWGKGTSTVAEVMGFNYIAQGSTDEQHARFPHQPGVGTEEGQTTATRGVYVDDPEAHRIASYDRPPMPGFYSLESGWKHYASRPYLAGMFVWSGFDYRGEPSPFGWPSVSSYTGMLDVCGYPKDIAWYFRSWWTQQPVLHLLPHWNWPGREGQPIAVWAYSNCEEVELFLNGKSQGRRRVLPNGHAEWSVGYRPGVLEAVGYRNGKKWAAEVVRTGGVAKNIVLEKDFSGGGVTVVRVKAVDAAGNVVPVADNKVFFDLSGPAKIIGVGNGDPVSHEADKFIESVLLLPVGKLQVKALTAHDGDGYPETGDAGWSGDLEKTTDDTTAVVVMYKGDIDLAESPDGRVCRLFYKSIGRGQRVYLNRQLLGRPVDGVERSEFRVDNSMLRKGKNELVIIARPFRKRYRWDAVNYDPGVLQVVVPATRWQRRLFNGLAQVIVEGTGEAGNVTLTAVSEGLEEDVIQIGKGITQ